MSIQGSVSKENPFIFICPFC